MRNQSFDELLLESEQLTIGWDKEPPMELFEYTDEDDNVGLMTKAGSKFPQKMLEKWAIAIDESKRRINQIDKLQAYIDNYIIDYEDANKRNN